jgi:hypothetical protein
MLEMQRRSNGAKTISHMLTRHTTYPHTNIQYLQFFLYSTSYRIFYHFRLGTKTLILPVLGIQIHMLLGLLDPDPEWIRLGKLPFSHKDLERIEIMLTGYKA